MSLLKGRSESNRYRIIAQEMHLKNVKCKPSNYQKHIPPLSVAVSVGLWAYLNPPVM